MKRERERVGVASVGQFNLLYYSNSKVYLSTEYIHTPCLGLGLELGLGLGLDSDLGDF